MSRKMRTGVTALATALVIAAGVGVAYADTSTEPSDPPPPPVAEGDVGSKFDCPYSPTVIQGDNPSNKGQTNSVYGRQAVLRFDSLRSPHCSYGRLTGAQGPTDGYPGDFMWLTANGKDMTGKGGSVGAPQGASNATIITPKAFLNGSGYDLMVCFNIGNRPQLGYFCGPVFMPEPTGSATPSMSPTTVTPAPSTSEPQTSTQTASASESSPQPTATTTSPQP